MKRGRLGTFLVLLACGGEDPVPTTPSIDAAFVGTWRLQTVNGQPLPYTVTQSGTSRTELQSGSISTTAGGSFGTQMNSVVTSPGLISIHLETDAGYFTVEGGTMTFHFSKAGTTAPGTLSHDTLTVVEGALTLALTR